VLFFKFTLLRSHQYYYNSKEEKRRKESARISSMKIKQDLGINEWVLELIRKIAFINGPIN
jgi:hypothetical protein